MALTAQYISAPFVYDERGSLEENDLFAESFISKKFQAFDRELYSSKWFDYRFMTPLQATWTYIEAYGPVYTRIYRQGFDARTAEYIKPITIQKIRQGLINGDRKTKVMFTGCWRGRQFADAIGIPYHIYIDLAFRFRLRAWKRPYMPQPQHLYHEFDLESIQEKWQELQKDEIYVSDHYGYMLENYRGAPAQTDYHEHLLSAAMAKSNTPFYLAKMCNEGRLPVEKVYARLDEREHDTLESYLAQS